MKRFSRVLAVFLILRSTLAFAFETDQYNLPPVPLADIGDEVAEYTEQNVRRAIDRVNNQIAVRLACLEDQSERGGCGSDETERQRLADLRSEDTMIREVFKLLGGGVPPFTNSGSWMEKHRFRVQPARFKTSYADSIFRTAPFDYLTISATVRLYGFEFGTDKIAHFFQQGYGYYRSFQKSRAKGLTERQAERKAFKGGVFSEDTYYGTLVGGVYSNADLAANFAGMRFYENLTHEVLLGTERRPPILVIRDGRWQFNENIDVRDSLLRPFLSNHLNEARNPSVYFNLFGFRSFIRGVVRKQACPEWRERFPGTSKAEFVAETDSLLLWHGATYGAKNSGKRITIAETCFD